MKDKMYLLRDSVYYQVRSHALKCCDQLLWETIRDNLGQKVWERTRFKTQIKAEFTK